MANASTRRRFLSSVKRGTGEAFLIMRARPDMDFSREITLAALKNHSLDQQSEGSRAWYATGLMDLCPKRDAILKSVLRALATERQDDWSLVQLFDIAAAYAKRGDAGARDAVYARYRNNPPDYMDWCGEDNILDLDGMEGAKFIAEQTGRGLEANPDKWEDGDWIHYFQKANPSIPVMEILEKEAETNRHIRIFLDAIEKCKRGRAEHKSFWDASDGYEKVLQIINDSTKKSIVPRKVVKGLSGDELRRLADGFRGERRRSIRERYLCVFSERQYPCDYHDILPIAAKRKSTPALRYRSVRALSFFQGEDIRRLFFEKMATDKEPEQYLPLLYSNYREGDHEMLADLVRSARSQDRLDTIAGGCVGIYERNRTPACVLPLVALYDRLTCGIHRRHMLKTLMDNEALPERIAEEMPFDSYEETRALCGAAPEAAGR